MVLITDKTYPRLVNTLSDSQTNWIDKIGDCDIRHRSLIIKVAGQEDNIPTKPSSTSKISEADIKLILFFLQSPENVDRAYREIQEKVGSFLGTITKAFDLSKTKQYLV